MICISIGNREQIRDVNELNPTLVEVRYDLMHDEPSALKGLINKNIRQIATCRQGMYPEERRQEILLQAVELGAAYVDIEIESAPALIAVISELARKKACSLILSYHNFEFTPTSDELASILHSCYSSGADVAKIACMVNSKKDNARLLSLYGEEGRKVVLGMGDPGKITRLAALDLGAEFTFAALSAKDATAPGQLTYDQINSLFNQIHKK